MHRLREELEDFHDLRGKYRGLGQLRPKGLELGLARKVSVPEEPHDFLEGSVAGKIFDVVALVREPPVHAIQVAEASRRGHGALETPDQPALGTRHATAFRATHI